jgi:predicted outer membrane repeat protein
VLRDAITQANTSIPTGGCGPTTATPAVDTMRPDCLCTANTIMLPSTVTITLTQADDATSNTGLPAITSSLTILGNGSVVRRDPGLVCNQDGVNDAGEFGLIYANSPLLVLDHLTLSNGCADSADYAIAKGGAIVNFGALVLQNVVLSDNYANNRGGALYSSGYLPGAGNNTIADSTFSGNVSLTGGAIFVEGTSAILKVSGGLFVQNMADAQYGGGAIAAGLSTTSNVVNSTFAKNAAGYGSAIQADGTVALSSSTIAENTSGASGAALQVATSGVGQHATIKNSLFAANAGAGSCNFAGGAVTLAGNNVSSDGSCTGLDLGNTDALLLPLGDHGGPNQTYGLQSRSPAVDAAVDCTDANGFDVTTDQRGAPRPVAILNAALPRCDIGAYELGDAIFKEGFDPPPSSA